MYKIVAVKDTSTTFLHQLQLFELQIGIVLTVTERLPYDNSVMVKNEAGKGFQLSEKIAKNLLVV